MRYSPYQYHASNTAVRTAIKLFLDTSVLCDTANGHLIAPVCNHCVQYGIAFRLDFFEKAGYVLTRIGDNNDTELL
jgi:hypothetical protein